MGRGGADAEALAESPVRLRGYYGWLPRAVRAHVLLLRGQVEGAADLLGDVIGELLGETSDAGDPQTLLPPCTVAGLIAQAQGDRQQVDRCLDAAVRAATGASWFVAMELPDLVRLSVAGGRAGTMQELLTGVGEQASRQRCALLTVRATLLEQDGQDEDALEAHRRAAAAWETYGGVPERGLALLGAARCLSPAPGRGRATGRRPAAAGRCLAAPG